LFSLLDQEHTQGLQSAEDQPSDGLAATAQVPAYIGQRQSLKVVQLDGLTLILGQAQECFGQL
jgi:hypothetical protein